MRILNRLTGLALRDRLVLVSDGAGWIIEDVANSLRAHVGSQLKPVVVADGWRQAKRCTVHFIERTWARSDTSLEGLDASNRLVGLWWHGRLDSTEPEILAALDRLRRCHHRFVRMQVPCQQAKQTLLALGIPEGKIVILPEGVDLHRFHPPRDPQQRLTMRRRLGVPNGSIAIGCFQKDGAGWGEGSEPKLIKGPDVLVEVLTRLHRRYPIHAVIPGPSRGYVKNRLQRAGVPYAAPGFVSDSSWPSSYYALDLYLSPSRDEGGPAGVLESMASSVPVIATRTGMAADIIQHGLNGFLADIEDVDGLVTASSELIERPARRSAIAAEALRTIQAFDWPILGRRYAQELYHPVMSE